MKRVILLQKVPHLMENQEYWIWLPDSIFIRLTLSENQATILRLSPECRNDHY